ncbi:unnamed protein product [Mesocestoides corti]|uniref:RNase_PH domain-containing protein n=1 Tax=Mesocestoides corti TaxID=53468 RepID=A0A0R3U5E5_MESCO|nr:unnamed protein product [Mesocestoides corti]
MQKPNLYISVNCDCNATGSSTWAFGNTHVLASIYGPKEASMANELTHRAFLDVSVLPVSGVHTMLESDMEFYLLQYLERLIDVKDYPRCQFNIRIQLVSGPPGHPMTMAACINALALALLQTSIPLKASVVAVCTSEVDADSRPITLAIDISHPSIAKKAKRGNAVDVQIAPRGPLVFAAYSGRPRHTPAAPISISSSKLLSLTTLSGEGAEQLCSRALDLYDAMIGHIFVTQS